jgi:hypothetical protein
MTKDKRYKFRCPEENMAKYSKKSQRTVKSAVRRHKKGKLISGRSGKKVKSRKQAIAIGLSEARKKGYKVPKSSKGKNKKTNLKRTKNNRRKRKR